MCAPRLQHLFTRHIADTHEAVYLMCILFARKQISDCLIIICNREIRNYSDAVVHRLKDLTMVGIYPLLGP